MSENLRTEVINGSGGIYPPYEIFYLLEIIKLCERFGVCYNDFVDQIEAEKTDSALFSLQEALSYAAALSRFFWPVDKRAPFPQARGQKLRQSFGLDDTSVLKDRSLRNALEHFDENLDEYLLGNVVGQYVRSFVGSAAEVVAPSKVIRLLDPETEVFYLLGTGFSFASIRDAVGDLFARAIELDGNGARLAPHPKFSEKSAGQKPAV